MNVSKHQTKVGLIKGGQLARLIIQHSANFGQHYLVLDDDPLCPCHSLAELVLGDCSKFDDVYHFGKKLDILTFEYEHINVEALKKLKAEGSTIYPDPSIIELVQNKAVQKEFYVRNGIPTSEFVLLDNAKSISKHEHFLPAVQKTCKAGYDGKGIYKIATQADMVHAFDEPSFLERWVDFDKEISVLVARSSKGEVAIYPTVEMMFHPQRNLVEFLFCPASIPHEVDQKARQIAMDIAQKIGLVGILAVEMFVDKNQNVLVNEIAPRVHNSAHHTIEGSLTSQFEQHMRCILGLPLGPTDLTLPSVMVNILGEEGYEGNARYEGVKEAEALGGVYVHFYGKAVTKPFRKMGHATVLDQDLKKAVEKARQVKNILKVRT